MAAGRLHIVVIQLRPGVSWDQRWHSVIRKTFLLLLLKILLVQLISQLSIVLRALPWILSVLLVVIENNVFFVLILDHELILIVELRSGDIR